MEFKVFDAGCLDFFTEARNVMKYVGGACEEITRHACFFFVAGCEDTPSKDGSFHYTWSCWDNSENYSELASVIVQALFSPHNKDLLRMTVEECVKRADNEMLKEIRIMADTRISTEGEQ